MFTDNTVLAHFEPSCPVGISCDASDAGVGAVLFHPERPIANASKTLTATQKRYPQIQKEALSIIFALKKFHQFLYGRKFILVTDHKPLWNSLNIADSLLPSPAYIAQERQATDATKSQQKEHSTVQHVRTRYNVGTPCYALYCSPRHTNSTRWVPATVTKVHGTRSFTVKVHPRGPLWKRHWEQLRPRYDISEDADPGFNYGDRHTPTIDNSTPAPHKDESTTQPPSDETNQQTVLEYGRHNPRRSGRNRKPRHPCNINC